MIHFNEHTLELYVLNSPKVEAQRDEIETHLTQCHGCLALVEEMRAFHKQLAEELKQTPIPETNDTKALAKRKQEIEPYFEQFTQPAPYSPTTILGHVRYFIIRHPVVTTATGLTFAMLLGAMFGTGIKDTVKEWFKDKNPAYYISDTKQNKLNVFNEEDELIWSMNAVDLDQFERDNKGRNIIGTDLIDMNNDGKKEVITILHEQSEKLLSMNNFRIIDVYNNFVNQADLSQYYKYLSRNYYGTIFYSTSFAIVNKDNNSKQLYLSCCNSSRSPSYITRISPDGKLMGKYWHFGHGTVYSLDINNDRNDEIVFAGINDTPDSIHQEYAAIAIIDPAKIVGDKKSVLSPGYDMAYSNAELFYIRIPQSMIDSILKVTYNVESMQSVGHNLLLFDVSYGLDIANNRIHLNFYFTKNMEMVKVTSNNITNSYWRQLMEEGKASNPIDEEFLDKMKNGVRYWDGKEWQKEWTIVKHE